VSTSVRPLRIPLRRYGCGEDIAGESGSTKPDECGEYIGGSADAGDISEQHTLRGGRAGVLRVISMRVLSWESPVAADAVSGSAASAAVASASARMPSTVRWCLSRSLADWARMGEGDIANRCTLVAAAVSAASSPSSNCSSLPRLLRLTLPLLLLCMPLDAGVACSLLEGDAAAGSLPSPMAGAVVSESVPAAVRAPLPLPLCVRCRLATGNKGDAAAVIEPPGSGDSDAQKGDDLCCMTVGVPAQCKHRAGSHKENWKSAGHQSQ